MIPRRISIRGEVLRMENERWIKFLRFVLGNARFSYKSMLTVRVAAQRSTKY